MTNSKLSDPYYVKQGDTLSKIARDCGKPVSELVRLNSIKNPNALDVGQTLYLSEETAFGFSALFLDALRNPIENLLYKIRFDDQVRIGKTGKNGHTPPIITKNAKSAIEISISDLQGKWKPISRTESGYGYKLSTLTSNSIVMKSSTEVHPKSAPGKPSNDASIKKTSNKTTQPIAPKKPTGVASKNNPAVKTKKKKGKKGQSIISIGVEIPSGLLELFAKHTGQAISDSEWTRISGILQCEPAVLKAIAKVESGGNSAFWRLNKADGAQIPAILFERHYFSKLTNGDYDKDHPDISWPVGYKKSSLIGKKLKSMHDGVIDREDTYSGYASSYLRLIQAYKLDKEAALKSCSWGKFQVMGANYKLCDADSIDDFVIAMCTSEASQIELLANFILKKPAAWKNKKNKKLGKKISLLEAVQTKDWAGIAYNFNGPTYRLNEYDSKLENAYKGYVKK